MSQNPFSVWSEIIDLRNEKEQQKYALTDADIDVIERIFRGEHAGIHLHKLKGTHPAAISAYVNDTRRLIFIPKGSTLALVEILLDHKYPNLSIMQPGVAERLYQKPWNDIKDQAIEYEPIISIKDFTPNPDYVYQAPRTCVSYHQKFITLDGNQSGSFTLPTPAVIIGDPGSGKSIISSAMMKENLCAPAFIESGKKIVYFTESSGLSEKMEQAWLLDHPLTARQPEANLLLFADYEKILGEYGPPTIQDKVRVGQVEFEAFMQQRLSNKRLIKLHPFIKTPKFTALISTLYHEFQIITVCVTKERYLAPDRKANLPHEMRDWAYSEYERYLKNLETDRKFDPNLLLWEPNEKPFARVYHDEALCASPAINAMMHRLADANILYFADPNQENTRERSDLDFILSELGVNGKPATKYHLGVTYRLAPTMANVSNDLLILKQNVNGGKNEKNQSSQISCKADEHALPGTLQWVELAKCDQLVEDLNRHNEVFVVITYPEYIEKAQTLFGPKAYVCTIEEARGQEFDKGVFYRITDPNPSSSSTKKEIKNGPTLLQQIGKILSQLDEQLECKQHLAKAGEGNRHFEAYFNSIFIALTRIIRSGYFVEDGKPEDNEFHRRLKLSIDKHMSGVVIEKPIATISIEALIEKAKQDLCEGNLAQAKAGFLRAGVGEAYFEAALKAEEQRKAELIKSIMDDRFEQPDAYKQQHIVLNETTEPVSPRTPLSEQDVKFILSSVALKSKNKLASALKKIKDITQLLTITLDNDGNQVSLLQMIYRQMNLSDVLYAHINRLKNKNDIVALFKQSDFNSPVKVADPSGIDGVTPLIFAMVMTDSGRNIIKLLNQRSNKTFFQGLSGETLFGLFTLRDEKIKTSILINTLLKDVTLFYDLLIQNEAKVSKQAVSSWINPLIVFEKPSPYKLSILRCLMLLATGSDKIWSETAVAAVKFIFNLNDGELFKAADPIAVFGLESEPAHQNGECDMTLFDLMLTHETLSVLLLPFMTDQLKAKFTPTFLLSPFPKFSTVKYIRLDYFMKSEALSKVAVDCLKDALIPAEYQVYYEKHKSRLQPTTEGVPCSPIRKTDAEILSEILSALRSIEKAKQLFSLDKLNRRMIVNLLDAPRYKQQLTIILGASDEGKYITERRNFAIALNSFNIDAMMRADNKQEPSTQTPVLYYLIDRHFDFLKTFLNGSPKNENSKNIFIRFTTPYYSVTFQSNINLITLLGLLDPALFLASLKANVKLIQCVNWTMAYQEKGEVPKSVLSHLANRSTKEQFNLIFSFLESHKAQFASCLLIDNLFTKIKSERLGTHFDFSSLILQETGAKLLSLFVDKIVLHAAFDSLFTDDFISTMVGHGQGPNKEVQLQSHFHLMCLYPCLLPVIIKILSKAVLTPSILNLLTNCNVASDTTIASFHWSALSALLANPKQHPVIDTLIKTHPELVLQLQPDAWHAPVSNNNKFNLSKVNYLLMHVIIRMHSHTDIGKFFKTHYPEIVAEAEATLEKSIPTPHEVKSQNEVNLAHLNARNLIKSESVELLLSHLNNPETYHLFNTPLEGKSVLCHLLGIPSFLNAILKFFEQQAKSGSVALCSEFFKHNDINQMITVKVANAKRELQCPLITLLAQAPHGKTIIHVIMVQNPFDFINQISLQSLITPYEIFDSPIELKKPLLYFLSHEDILFFTVVCAHSKVLKSIPHLFMRDEFEHPSGAYTTLIGSIVNPLILEADDLYKSQLHLKALCQFFEAIPAFAVYLPIEQQTRYEPNSMDRLLFDQIMTAPNNLINRFFAAIKMNSALYDTLTQKYKISHPLPDSSDHQVTPPEEDTLVDWMNLLKKSNAALLLSEITTDQRTRFAHIMDDESCRSGFIEHIRKLPENDQTDFICKFFNSNPINQKIWFLPNKSTTVLCVLLDSDIVETIVAGLYKNPNSDYYFKNQELEFWLKPFHQWDEANPDSTFSHLDMLLSEPPLTEIAKLVINHRLMAFIETCFNEKYLFTPLYSQMRITSRLALLLNHPQLHSMFLVWHSKKALGLPALAAALSNHELLMDREHPNPLTNMLTGLNESVKGRQLLLQFKKMPELVANLDERMKNLVNNADNPPSPPSVTTCGIFSGNHPTSVMSDESVLGLVTEALNSEVNVTFNI